MKKGDKKLDEVAGLGKFGGLLFDIGWQLAIVVFGFLLLGRWLDNKLGTDPLFVLIGLILIIISFVLILRRILKTLPRSQGGLKND